MCKLMCWLSPAQARGVKVQYRVCPRQDAGHRSFSMWSTVCKDWLRRLHLELDARLIQSMSLSMSKLSRHTQH